MRLTTWTTPARGRLEGFKEGLADVGVKFQRESCWNADEFGLSYATEEYRIPRSARIYEELVVNRKADAISPTTTSGPRR